MRGAIIGDVIGSVHEYKDRIKSKEFKLFTKDNTFTDDTVLTIAVYDSLTNNIPYEESFKRVIRLKKHIRTKLPGGPEGKDYIFLSNLNHVDIKKELKDRLASVLPSLGDNPISSHVGAWDYFFFKYVHCPDTIAECKDEILIYMNNHILDDTNFISVKDFDIMVRNCTYVIPCNLI